MARPCEKVCDINETKDLWKVVVRVHHKWSVLSNGKEHFEMVVFDNDGTDIHVVVPTIFMPTFKDKFAIDNTYTLSNFMVVPNNLVFKPTNHRYYIKLTGGTSINDVNKHVVNAKPDNFTPFPDIIIGRYKKDMLIDIIGMVDSIGYTQNQNGGKKQQVNFTLRDHGNNTINCTLWETYAAQFTKYCHDRVNGDGPIVVLLQYAKVKEEG